MPTVLIGMIGGLIVGITSVGAGSLMIILLLFTYPLLSAGQLVGTDLTQAVPLTAAGPRRADVRARGVRRHRVDHRRQRAGGADRLAALLPGAGQVIRPAITFVIFASGLKYVGVPRYPLGFVMGGILLAGAGYLLAVRRPPAAAQGAAPGPAPAADQNPLRERRSGRRSRSTTCGSGRP